MDEWVKLVVSLEEEIRVLESGAVDTSLRQFLSHVPGEFSALCSTVGFDWPPVPVLASGGTKERVKVKTNRAASRCAPTKRINPPPEEAVSIEGLRGKRGRSERKVDEIVAVEGGGKQGMSEGGEEPPRRNSTRRGKDIVEEAVPASVAPGRLSRALRVEDLDSVDVGPVRNTRGTRGARVLDDESSSSNSTAATGRKEGTIKKGLNLQNPKTEVLASRRASRG